MVTKRLLINANTGTMFIGDSDTPDEASGAPYSYLNKLNFHSGLPYIQIKGRVLGGSLSFAAVPRGVTTWDDGSKGCGGGCYITTAAVKYMGEYDDSYVLTTLRNFRDTYMQSTPELKALVKEYYATAPIIVYTMEQAPYAPDIFKRMYTNYLLVAVDAIEKGDNEKALDVYKKMYAKLKRLAGL